MFTDTELGMAAGFARRSQDDADYAQALINHVHRQLIAERAARLRAEAALRVAQDVIQTLEIEVAAYEEVVGRA